MGHIVVDVVVLVPSVMSHYFFRFVSFGDFSWLLMAFDCLSSLLVASVGFLVASHFVSLTMRQVLQSQKNP